MKVERARGNGAPVPTGFVSIEAWEADRKKRNPQYIVGSFRLSREGDPDHIKTDCCGEIECFVCEKRAIAQQCDAHVKKVCCAECLAIYKRARAKYLRQLKREMTTDEQIKAKEKELAELKAKAKKLQTG